MRSTLKLLHLIGMAGFLGSLGACLVLATYGAKGDANAIAFMQAGLAYDVRHLTLPSLWVIVATGLVLTALQKQLAAWVYVKIAIGLVVLFLALFVGPAAGFVSLVLALIAAALGVVRPWARPNRTM
jgi:hypothetical protein